MTTLRSANLDAEAGRLDWTLFPPAAPTNVGRRRRRGGHPVTVDLHDPDELQPSQQGWVLDRSVSGLCLMAPNALPVGSFWKVRPCNAPQTTPAVRVEVIRLCGRRAGMEARLSFREDAELRHPIDVRLNRSLSARRNGYVTKPVPVDGLLRAIDKALVV